MVIGEKPKVVEWVNQVELAMQTSLAADLLAAIEQAAVWATHVDEIVAAFFTKYTTTATAVMLAAAKTNI